MGTLAWLLQWPVRAVVLLVVAALPLGVEVANFSTALWAAILIGLLGMVLILPLKLLLGPLWAITSLGGLIVPVSFLFNWLIATILFALASRLIKGFTLKRGIVSALVGAAAYSMIGTMAVWVLLGPGA